jgi:hypothetical protein
MTPSYPSLFNLLFPTMGTATGISMGAATGAAMGAAMETPFASLMGEYEIGDKYL